MGERFLKLKKMAVFAVIAGCLVGGSKISAEAAGVLPNGIYKISSLANTNYSLKVADWDKDKKICNVALGASKNVAEQAFRFTYDNKGCYYIRSVSTGLLLDVASKESGANVYVKDPAGYDSDTKKWIVVKQSDGSFVLYNKSSYVDSNSKRLEIQNVYQSEDANIEMYYMNNKYKTTQSWKITSMPSSVNEMNGYYKSSIAQYMVWWAGSSSSKGYDLYMMDIYPDSESNDNGTYWAMANYYMNNDGFIKKIGGKKISGSMVGYGGIQDTLDTTRDTKIHSMWDMEYYDKNGNKKVLQPKRMYPYGGDNRFDNEGNGSSYLGAYNVSFKTWYKGVFRCWKDSKLGTTFMGLWVQNKSTGRWDLVSYYNTGLYDSYINKDVAGFMENFSGNHWGKRSARVKNFYFRDNTSKAWSTTSSVKIYPEMKKGRIGTYNALSSSGYAYVESGLKTADQTTYDLAHNINGMYSVSSAGLSDTKVKPTISSIGYTKQNSAMYVNWTVPETSNPQLSYSVTVKKDGKTIYTDSATRPEIRSVCVGRQGYGKYTVSVTVTDIFGNSTTSSKVLNYS